MFLLPSRSLRREIQANLTLYLGVIISGVSLGYSSTAIPDIEREILHDNSTDFFFPAIEADVEDLSWFASSVNLGQIFGGILGGFLSSRYGPKRTVLMSCAPTVIGWILTCFGSNLAALIAGRVFTGMGGAFVATNASMLSAQYSSTKNRGRFLSLFTLMVSSGILISFCFGSILYWRYVVCVPLGLVVIFGTGLLQIPESPIWLLGHYGEEAATQSLVWLRATKDVGEELESVRKMQETRDQGLTLFQAIKSFPRPDIHRPILLVTINLILVVMSGPFAVVFYAVEIFTNAGVEVNSYLAAIIIGVVRVGAGILGIYVLNRFPRRIVGIYSMLMMLAGLVLLGLSRYLDHANISMPGISFLPLAALILYKLGFGVGVGPLQFVWMGELLPPEYKVFSGLIISIANLSIFTNTKIFPWMVMHLGSFAAYWVFSAFSGLAILLYLTAMPETKGLSNLEIRQLFQKKKSSEEKLQDPIVEIMTVSKLCPIK